MTIAIPVIGTRISVSTFGQPVVDAVNDHESRLDVIEAAEGWLDWTPTLTNLVKGSGGLVTARYRQLAKTVDFYFRFTYGTGSSVGTSPMFTLPVAMASYFNDESALPFAGEIRDSGITGRPAQLAYSAASTVSINYWNSTPAPTTITSGAPWSWGTGDRIAVSGTYETV